VTLYASNGLFQQINKILSHDSYKILTNEVALKDFMLNSPFDFDHILHF